ncbi:hypothetical protein SprV_0100236900 [Sparganum proliferum]
MPRRARAKRRKLAASPPSLGAKIVTEDIAGASREVDVEDSCLLQSFRFRGLVHLSQLQYSARTVEMEIIELPYMAFVGDPCLRSVKERHRDDDLIREHPVSNSPINETTSNIPSYTTTTTTTIIIIIIINNPTSSDMDSVPNLSRLRSLIHPTTAWPVTCKSIAKRLENQYLEHQHASRHSTQLLALPRTLNYRVGLLSHISIDENLRLVFSFGANHLNVPLFRTIIFGSCIELETPMPLDTSSSGRETGCPIIKPELVSSQILILLTDEHTSFSGTLSPAFE